MQPIKGSIYTHLVLKGGDKVGELQRKMRSLEESFTKAGVNAVGGDEGLCVDSYRGLVQRIASIAYENSHLMLAYRGQTTDYRVRGNSKRSSLYPTIYRENWKKYKLTPENRPEYFKRLSRLVGALRPELFPEPQETKGETEDGLVRESFVRSRNYREQMLALIQHYELFPTPMIDATQSLQVACSFALNDSNDGRGFIYVFGMPPIGGSVSYSVEDEICIARLQTVCPPKAIRAHFQDGLLISNFPETRRKSDRCNLANRLLAKFVISREEFWSDGFQPLDPKSLLPEEDSFDAEIREIRERVYPDLYDGLDSESSISAEEATSSPLSMESTQKPASPG